MRPSAAATGVLSGVNLPVVVVIAVIGVLALVLAVVFRRDVLSAKTGTTKMEQIAQAIQEGASAFLNRQMRTLVIFAAAACALLALIPGDGSVRIGRMVYFVLGAAFSASIGYLGMSLATRANVRVAAAAAGPGGRKEAARLAFRTGGVVGMTTVGLGLLGAASVVLIYREQAPSVLEGFGFGAAMLAMFMRVGGGIFTKAADVGADLVGKVEQHIPEDDPRNAATVADNVGDNVGDCAGMAADLFESYAVTLVASLILGQAVFGSAGLIFPLIIPAIGAITAAGGILMTSMKDGKPGIKAIYRGFYLSALIAGIAAVAAAFIYLPSTFAALPGLSDQLADHPGDPRLIVSGAVLIGLALAGCILWLTGYFTGTEASPTRHVARTTVTGPATVVLAGLGIGFESAVYTAGIIAAAMCGVFLLAGGNVLLSLFLVALAGCGLLTTVGMIVAMDTFGPVSDNAQGIAEMSGDVDERGAAILTDLDAVGNTTKAITKGIAIGTAVLAATALFGSYMDSVATAVADATERGSQITGDLAAAMLNYQIVSPITLVGVILGAATVFLFSGLTIDAVTRAAGAIVLEVRNQFRLHPGIMTGEEMPEYGRVVDICTKSSLRELATPGLLAVMAPIGVGFGLGVGPLAGFLGGAIAAGLLMAIFLANSGGAWDNAKKLIEDGAHGGKNSPAHDASIIGDTVGDPFKDTAGPAINPLIKVMNLVSLLVAPIVVSLSTDGASPVLRIGIATGAMTIALGAIVFARFRATRTVDTPDQIEHMDDDPTLGVDPQPVDHASRHREPHPTNPNASGEAEQTSDKAGSQPK